VLIVRSGVNWASTLVGFLALVCTPMPFLFNKARPPRVHWTGPLADRLQYGAAIRRRCKYAGEAAQVAQMMKERALKQREMENAHHQAKGEKS
jgi:hypothetical protein